MTTLKFHTCHPTNESSHFLPSLARLKTLPSFPPWQTSLGSMFFLKCNNNAYNFLKNCGKTHNIKFTISTIFKCIPQQGSIYSHCCATDLQNFFIFQNWHCIPIEQLLPIPRCPSPWKPHSTFSFYYLTALDTLYNWNSSKF